jgi:hypothetical protein
LEEIMESECGLAVLLEPALVDEWAPQKEAEKEN